MALSIEPKGSWLQLTFQGSLDPVFLLLDKLPKKSKSSSKALSVCEVLPLPLLAKIEGLELPSLPKLSTLTPSLLERVVKVGEPGGLRSIKQTLVLAASDGLGTVGNWNVVLVVRLVVLLLLPLEMIVLVVLNPLVTVCR